jgi:probable rRNA maturation factor
VLNGQFRGKAQPTNVLSWPTFYSDMPEPPGNPGEGPLFIGDLALGYETCAAEAAAAGIPLADHAAHLVVHGVLHLLGHDHDDDAKAETMENLETKVLASMGVANPYST